MDDILSIGVDWSKVMYADTFWLDENFADKTAEFKKRILKRWYLDFVYSEFNIQGNETYHTLCFRSLVRDDYKELFAEMNGCIDQKKIVIEDYKVKSEKINLDASRFLADNNWASKIVSSDCQIKRLCLFIKLCSYLFVLEKVSKISFKRLVLFADMQPIENLLEENRYK